MSASARRPARVAILLALLGACNPSVSEGQFACEPGDPDACPEGFICLVRGTLHRCYRDFRTTCGNGKIDPGEQCDGDAIPAGACAALGYPGGTAACLDYCLLFCTYCGNGVLDVGEVCDHGPANADLPDAACRPDCTPRRCGDGVQDSGETCDLGPENSDEPGAACRKDCTSVGCGDGITDADEGCDDGNPDDGDGCSAACAVEPGWTCLGAAGSTCLPVVFVPAPAGDFLMGPGPGDAPQYPDGLQVAVTLTRPFEILATEVTQAVYERVTGYAPSEHAACGPDCPVDRVSWDDAADFCNTLSDLAGLARCYTCAGATPDQTCELAGAAGPYACAGYRLPTFAEWEYAARAGAPGATYHGTSANQGCDKQDAILDAIAWYCEDEETGSPHPVALKAPNPWGLYDVLGNVREWTTDRWWSWWTVATQTDPWNDTAYGPMTLTRGGDYRSIAEGMTLWGFSGALGTDRVVGLGFRPVRTLAP
jgi:cysteine-rich repeat protein